MTGWELREGYRVTFSLFFCPCIEEDGDCVLSSQKEETGLSLELGSSYYLPAYHLPLLMLSQPQQTVSAPANDSLVILSHPM